MQWEFAYVDLWLGSRSDGDARDISEVQEEIAKLGENGWEPVGEIQIEYQLNEMRLKIPKLLFKRPIGSRV